MNEWSPQELISAHVDGELETEAQRAEVEELLASERWRRRARLEVALRDALRQGVPGRVPPEVREAVEAVVDGERARPWTRWLSVGLVAACVALAISVVHFGSEGPGEVAEAEAIPMVDAVVEDFTMRASGPLPPMSSMIHDPTWEATAELRDAGARVVSSWTVRVRGEDAVAYAYQWEGQVIVQYVVSTELFLRQPVVRDAISDAGKYETSTGGHYVRGWLGNDRGLLVVGRSEARAVLARRLS